MNSKAEGILNNLAATFVLFAAILDPRISAGLTVVFIIGLGAYHLARKN